MPVTQPTEKPGFYFEKFNAIKEFMMASPKHKKLYTEAEMDVMIKNSLILEAEDKVEYSLKNQIRRGMPGKKGMSEAEFSTAWRKKMRERLKNQDKYPTELKPDEVEILEAITERNKQQAVEEIAQMTSQALKQILSRN